MQRLLNPARRTMPLSPQLLKPRLSHPLPLRLQRRDLALQLRQRRLDIARTSIQLTRNRLQLLRRNSNIRHTQPPNNSRQLSEQEAR